MRGAGCTWNDITDRDYDGRVAHTANSNSADASVAAPAPHATMIRSGTRRPPMWRRMASAREAFQRQRVANIGAASSACTARHSEAVTGVIDSRLPRCRMVRLASSGCARSSVSSTSAGDIAALEPLQPQHTLALAECQMLQGDGDGARASLRLVIGFCAEHKEFEVVGMRAQAISDLMGPSRATEDDAA